MTWYTFINKIKKKFIKRSRGTCTLVKCKEEEFFFKKNKINFGHLFWSVVFI